MDGAGESRSSASLPSALVLFAGLLAILLRPPIPLDETRYLEIAREMKSGGGPWLLLLNGEPYAHKPPLLFALGVALSWFGVSLEFAMRFLPALASAGTVLVVGRLARIAGARDAAWIQAAMLVPLVWAQVLFFDAVLALWVWLALLAWTLGRDRLALLAAAAAFLTKGPVAIVPLLAFGWALIPLRPSPARSIPRLLGVVGGGLLALGAWAFNSARIGGEDFAQELLWRQTFGRMSSSFAHREPFWFYAPVLVLGVLPCLALLPACVRGMRGARDTRWRLAWAATATLLVLSLSSGKQPHYLLPIFPALALLFGLALAARPDLARRIAWTASLVLAAEAVGLGLAWRGRADTFARYGEYGAGLLAAPEWNALVLCTAAFALAAAVGIALARFDLRRTLTAFALAQIALLAPVHAAFGALVLPRRIEALLLARPNAPLATYGNQQAGLYNWLAARDRIDELRTPDDARAWCADHPGGLIVAEEQARAAFAGLPAAPLARDLVRGSPQTLWQVAER
jgi:4-amino-4-deoxy-L-arabinose transferase-like glycosyltransferase